MRVSLGVVFPSASISSSLDFLLALLAILAILKNVDCDVVVSLSVFGLFSVSTVEGPSPVGVVGLGVVGLDVDRGVVEVGVVERGVVEVGVVEIGVIDIGVVEVGVVEIGVVETGVVEVVVALIESFTFLLLLLIKSLFPSGRSNTLVCRIWVECSSAALVVGPTPPTPSRPTVETRPARTEESRTLVPLSVDSRRGEKSESTTSKGVLWSTMSSPVLIITF